MRGFWTALKLVGGGLLVAFEAVLLFLLSDRALGRTPALIIVGLGLVVLPIALTAGLLRGLRKIDPDTTFLRNLPGFVAVSALLVSGALLLFARGSVAEAFERAPRRYPSAGGALGGLSRGLSEWLKEEPDAPSSRATTAHPGKGKTKAAPAKAAPSAKAPAKAPVPAKTAAPSPATATATSTSTSTATATATATAAGSEIAVCDRIASVATADLGQENLDEILVECGKTIHVLWPRPDGAIVERTRFTPEPPEGLEVLIRAPRLVDVDADGQEDVLLCLSYSTERGGMRGGVVSVARGLPTGQFAPPTHLVSVACAGVDLGNVDADPEPELVVADAGNPYQPERPHGNLRWLDRVGRRFAEKGRTPLGTGPYELTLADANGDSILDAVVAHSWTSQGTTVSPGGPRGLLPMDPTIPVPPLPDRRRARARFDGDDQPDTVTAREGKLFFERTARDAPAVRALTKALDYLELSP